MKIEFEQFIQHYSAEIGIDDATKAELAGHFSIVECKKKSVLVREDELHDYGYYVLKGAIRSYYLKDAIEINTWFALEKEFVGAFQNYKCHKSRVTLESLEDSRLIAINLVALKLSMNSNVQVSNFVLAIVEEYTQFLEERLFATQFMNAMERYAYLFEHDRNLLNRVPLTHIASYLGVSRETLSRIRGK